MGFRTVALSRGADKAAFARQLGAHEYIDTAGSDSGSKLAALGGAKVALATAPSGKAISSLVPGLSVDGEIVVIAVPADPVQVDAFELLSARRSVLGWYSGMAMDSEDTIRFAVQAGIKPMIETFPLEKANEAYEHMITDRARFRVVLTMDHLGA
jgi:D-arabinose 1-dehydrogenase-like Zn-dependent alcohol dehydrogenase